MIRTLTAIAVVLLTTASIAAQEASPVTPDNQPEFATAAVAVPTITLITAIDAICQSTTWTLSANARTACDTGRFPRLRKDGEAFGNSSVGAEFNTIMRQMTAAN